MRIIYDIETYPNVFTFTAEMVDSEMSWQFEISDWKNDCKEFLDWLIQCKIYGWEMVGFNNIGFDYPVIHWMWQHGNPSAAEIYQKAHSIIFATKEDRFKNIVWPNNRLVKQLDLFKVHHFDNKARMTSLKALEFNMRLDSVEDLPFKSGTTLTREEARALMKYNKYDVTATKKFYNESLSAIELREQLSKKYNRDFTNHNNVKIGKEIFELRLKASGIDCYDYSDKGRKPRQTKRDSINLKDCIPNYIKFKTPEFNNILDYLLTTIITETKGAFKDLSANYHGLKFDFGTGGLHASVSNKVFQSDDDYVIIDADVTSMYPSIAIVNKYYPEHLGEKFVEVYSRLKEERLKHKKGTPENEALKLALNGTFGATNDMYSVFYDPLCTMQITITGQLCLAMLVDMLARFFGERVTFIQANTDGITIKLPRGNVEMFGHICKDWEKITGLGLEYVNYDKMFIADVNNYIAVSDTGKVKRKGRYEYNTQWHQNASKLVVPKVAEKVLLEDVSIGETVRNWSDRMDFMCRVKVPRTGHLIGETPDGQRYSYPNMSRYYVSQYGLKLIKVLAPLKKNPDKWREIGVESGWSCCVCNKIKDATLPINYDYYAKEVEKIVMGFEDA